MNLSHPAALIINSGHLITKACQECTDPTKKARIAELLWQVLEVAALVDGMTRDELHAKLLEEPAQIEMGL
jgi:hypothetical protein